MKSTDRDIHDDRLADIPDEELVRLVRDGDENALEFIFRKYKKLFENRADRYFLPGGGDRQDLVQEGMIGFYKAIIRYDPGKNVPFASFADMCVSSQIKSAVTSYNAKKHGPLNTSVNLEGGSVSDGEGAEDHVPVDLPDESPGPEEYVILRESPGGSVLDDIPGLSSYERSVLELYAGGMSVKDIAEKLKRPVKSIDNAVQRIRRKRRSQQCRKQ